MTDKELCEEIIKLGKALNKRGLNPRFTAQSTTSCVDSPEKMLATEIIEKAKKLVSMGINPKFTCAVLDNDIPKRGRGAIRPLKYGGHWNHIKEGEIAWVK